MTENLKLGATNALLAAALFASAAACVKVASESVDNTIIVFARNLTGLVLLLPWMLRKGSGGLATKNLVGHLWRALFGVAAMYCFFYAISHLHLAEAVLLTYSAPLYIPLLAWWWLREPPPSVMLPALALGVGGIVLIAKPSPGELLSPAAGIGVLSGAFAAAAMVTIRKISDTEPAVRIVSYFALLSTVLTAVPLAWTWRTPDAEAMAWLFATGVLATAGQLFLTRAYSLAPAARIGAYTYSSVIFAGAVAWLAWNEVPDLASLAGMALVVGCCVLAGWRPRTTPA